MISPKRILFFLAGWLVVCACSQQKEEKAYHYNIDSLVQHQIEYLVKAQATLSKEAIMNGQRQDSVFVPKDSLAWARELDLFREIGSINKPINQNNYKISDGLTDTFSNLTVRQLTATSDLPIRYVKIFYQDAPSKLRKIEALYQQENSLLKTKRKLIMEFTDLYNKNILTSYSVDGGQKMFVGDSVHYVIKGSIQVN
ncbi:MAG: hypothetical protein KF725_01165 [Cyclobacteriaceae bacterium]|nr:hypothetical protein [Cyclobacteriaceae bacterium]UYN86935.1 MAG: hypothetical protein KIT51_01240 [Cyclobacteriaceae bacterium]